MKGSKYDTKHDGTCSASACKDVLLLADTHACRLEAASRSIQAERGEDRDHIHGACGRRAPYPTLQTTVEEHPHRRLHGLEQGLRRPAHVLRRRCSTAARSSRRQLELLARRDHACQAGSSALTGNVTNVPSVDADLDRCAALAGSARLTCYEALDRKLMTKVVPWIPYLWRSPPTSPARRSRSGSSTSSSRPPRTRTSRSSELSARRRSSRGRAPRTRAGRTSASRAARRRRSDRCGRR